MKKIFFIITFILSVFLFLPTVNANFIHNGTLSLKLKSNGKTPTCSLTPNRYTNSSVEVNLSTATNYTTEYRLTESGSWDTYSSASELSFNGNTTFDMRYKDGNGNYSQIGKCVIDNIDTEHPNISISPTTSTTYKKKVDGTITVTDNVGIDSITYAISESNTTAPTSGWVTVSGDDQTSKTIPVSDGTDTGTFYLWATATDIAGNTNQIVRGPYLLDNTPPTVDVEDTSASDSDISIKVTSDDLHSGIKGYYYSIDDGVTWSTIQTSGFYMFAGLENNTTYNIKVKVEDNVGNIAISDPVTIKTAAFGNITVSVDNERWATKKSATVSFESISGYTYQFSTDGGNTWITITSTSQVTYTHNGIFMVKVSGEGEEQTYSYPVTHIDPIPVTVNSVTTPTSKITEQSFQVVVDAIDTGSDEERSEIAGYKYSVDGIMWTELTTSNEHTFYGLVADTEYTVYVKVYDNAGNITNATTTVTTSEVTDIFLDGTNGNNNNDGLSPLTAVKTFAKAKTLLKRGATLWICGQVTISEDEAWDLTGIGESGGRGIIKRWDGISVSFSQAGNKIPFTTRLILVNPGIKLSLTNLILDGNKDNVVGTNGTSALIQTAGDIYIDNCILRNNKAPATGVAINSRLSTSYRPTIEIKNSTFSGNEGTSFGASNGTIAYDKGDIIVDNTEFKDNFNAISGVFCSAYKSGITDRTLTITNSSFTNNSGDKGSVAIDSYDTVTISDTIISGNSSGSNTIYLNGLSSLTLNNTTITNNTALNGGAIYMTNANSVLKINDSELSHNTVTGSGAAIYENNGTLTINNTQINNNVGLNGGGVYLNTGKATVNNSPITNNTGTYGGGLYINNAAAILSVNDCNISDNTVTGRGGGIYIGNGTVNIDSVTISNNNANSSGSGLFFGNGSLNMKGTISIKDNVNSTTKGDIFLANNKIINVTGDLTGSNIGIFANTKPTATVPVDIAIPITGYTMPSTYYGQFFANQAAYETANSIYDTTNNKVQLKIK